MSDSTEVLAVRRSEPLRDQVMDAVLKLLQGGELAPGTRVTEQGLAKTLNVSRTPIREALGRLSQQGILEHRQSGGGYYVPLPTVDELHDIIAVRLLLEPPAARMAAEEFGSQKIQALDAAMIAEGGAATKKGSAEFAEANQAFRTAIFGAVKNLALREAIAQFDNHLHFIRSTTLNDLGLRKEIIRRQRQIRDAIADRDGDLAEGLWRSYLRLTEDSLVAALRRWDSAEGK